VIRPGQIVLLNFPQTDQGVGKLRPALILRRLPGPYDDWLICMVSSWVHQHIVGIDEIIAESEDDFSLSGLKSTSLVRVTRLAVLAGASFRGSIGRVSDDRLKRVWGGIAAWIQGTAPVIVLSPATPSVGGDAAIGP
jgi:mRNA interferase MazF